VVVVRDPATTVFLLGEFEVSTRFSRMMPRTTAAASSTMPRPAAAPAERPKEPSPAA
jgi:hypothetical protein